MKSEASPHTHKLITAWPIGPNHNQRANTYMNQNTK